MENYIAFKTNCFNVTNYMIDFIIVYVVLMVEMCIVSLSLSSADANESNECSQTNTNYTLDWY